MHNFVNQKQNAINQINEMKKRATPSAECKTPPQKKADNIKNHPQKPLFSAPLSINDDTLIVLGLILILSNESSDMLLLLALAYILM